MVQTVCALINTVDKQRLEVIAADHKWQRKHVERAKVVLTSVDGCRTYTGITTFSELMSKPDHIMGAGHDKLYDRRGDEVSIDEIENISI